MELEPFSLLFTAFLADGANLGCNLILWTYFTIKTTYFFIQLVMIPFIVSLGVLIVSILYTYSRRFHPKDTENMRRLMISRVTLVMLMGFNYLCTARNIPSDMKHGDLMKDYTFLGVASSFLACLGFLGVVLGDLNSTVPEIKSSELMA